MFQIAMSPKALVTKRKGERSGEREREGEMNGVFLDPKEDAHRYQSEIKMRGYIRGMFILLFIMRAYFDMIRSRSVCLLRWDNSSI